VTKELTERAAKVIRLASAAGLTLATVESCTAGALAVLLADAPDAGSTFHGGFVVYTKQNKAAALGVPARLIATKSAVSPEVAKAMAIGALDRCPADIAVAITGVAGPTPDEDGNPVGLVYIAAARRGGDPHAVEGMFEKSSRSEIRDRAMDCALELLETVLGEILTPSR
jgi:nicotinamide-nucleotide amidase